RRRIHDLSIRNEAAEDGLEIAARYPREHAVVQALERCEDVLSSERHTLVLCCWLDRTPNDCTRRAKSGSAQPSFIRRCPAARIPVPLTRYPARPCSRFRF